MVHSLCGKGLYAPLDLTLSFQVRFQAQRETGTSPEFQSKLGADSDLLHAAYFPVIRWGGEERG